MGSDNVGEATLNPKGLKDIVILNHKDEKQPTKPKVSDETVEAFMKNIDNYKGQNRDILIKLGLTKPDVEEKEQYNKPSWYNRFKDIDSHNNNNDSHKTKTINI